MTASARERGLFRRRVDDLMRPPLDIGPGYARWARLFAVTMATLRFDR